VSNSGLIFTANETVRFGVFAVLVKIRVIIELSVTVSVLNFRGILGVTFSNVSQFGGSHGSFGHLNSEWLYFIISGSLLSSGEFFHHFDFFGGLSSLVKDHIFDVSFHFADHANVSLFLETGSSSGSGFSGISIQAFILGLHFFEFFSGLEFFQDFSVEFFFFSKRFVFGFFGHSINGHVGYRS
jgi:hypothetical protein